MIESNWGGAWLWWPSRIGGDIDQQSEL
jgi:hypothetical protein